VKSKFIVINVGVTRVPPFNGGLVTQREPNKGTLSAYIPCGWKDGESVTFSSDHSDDFIQISKADSIGLISQLLRHMSDEDVQSALHLANIADPSTKE